MAGLTTVDHLVSALNSVATVAALAQKTTREVREACTKLSDQLAVMAEVATAMEARLDDACDDLKDLFGFQAVKDARVLVRIRAPENDDGSQVKDLADSASGELQTLAETALTSRTGFTNVARDHLPPLATWLDLVKRQLTFNLDAAEQTRKMDSEEAIARIEAIMEGLDGLREAAPELAKFEVSPAGTAGTADQGVSLYTLTTTLTRFLKNAHRTAGNLVAALRRAEEG